MGEIDSRGVASKAFAALGLQKYWIQPYVPHLALVAWCLPLLILSDGHNSLLAHDEGLYALRARAMFDSGDWVNPWEMPHHKTPGIYWAIALCYHLFGCQELAARVPSLLGAIASVILLYELGQYLLSPSMAWLGSAILSVEILWVRYGRLAGPDLPMIALVLLAVWCLLRAEAGAADRPAPQRRWLLFGCLAGMCLGLAFLVRGFLVVLAIAALMPYLVLQHRRHRHLFNPALYLGFGLGLLPLLLWVGVNYQRFGWAAIAQLLGLVVDLGSNERQANNWLYYLWNIPLNTLPWCGFALVGLGQVSRCTQNYGRYRSLLLGFPAMVLVGLHLFSTRLAHYGLLLYPWIALLAAVGLEHLGRHLGHQLGRPLPLSPPPRRFQLWRWRWVLGLAIALIGYVMHFASTWGDATALEWKYGLSLLATLLGGTLLAQIFWSQIFGAQGFEAQGFAAQAYGTDQRDWVENMPQLVLPQLAFSKLAFHCLLACWFGLATAGLTGLLSDHNPQVRQFLAQPAIAEVLQTHSIDFAQVSGKPAVLLKFYTPHWGNEYSSLAELPGDRYAWTCLQPGESLPPGLHSLGEVKRCQLVKP